jgi:hypothetical protein
LLDLPLRCEVRRQRSRLLAHPERAHLHEPLRAGGSRGRNHVARTVDHDTLELRGRSADDRDEMDDVRTAARGGEHACRVGHVAE